MSKFDVTFEIITAESAENGDCAESGFAGEYLSLTPTPNGKRVNEWDYHRN
jgi:hypothetical protein